MTIADVGCWMFPVFVGVRASTTYRSIEASKAPNYYAIVVRTLLDLRSDVNFDHLFGSLDSDYQQITEVPYKYAIAMLNVLPAWLI